MMNLPTPLSRTIFRRRTHGFARAPMSEGIPSSQRSCGCARHPRVRTPSSVSVVAQRRSRGRVLTLPESIPDFSLDTSRPYVQSVQTGSWSSAATWQGGQIPTSNQVVRILLAHTVTINDTAAVAYTIAIDGKLAFAPSVNTRLKVTNLQVMAGDNGMGTPGVLEVGTAAAPIAAGVTAEIIIANTPLGGGVVRPLAVRHRAHGARQGVDARQREDADLRAPRHRAARGQHDVDALGSGRGMEGRRPARPAGHAPHQGKRSDGRRLDERRQPVGRAHGAGHLRRWQDPHDQQRPAVRPPGRARLERRPGLSAARRQPDAQRHRPLGERHRHPRPHDRDAHGGRPTSAMRSSRTWDARPTSR